MHILCHKQRFWDEKEPLLRLVFIPDEGYSGGCPHPALAGYRPVVAEFGKLVA